MTSRQNLPTCTTSTWYHLFVCPCVLAYVRLIEMRLFRRLTCLKRLHKVDQRRWPQVRTLSMQWGFAGGYLEFQLCVSLSSSSGSSLAARSTIEASVRRFALLACEAMGNIPDVISRTSRTSFKPIFKKLFLFALIVYCVRPAVPDKVGGLSNFK